MQGELRAFLHRGIHEHSVTSEALVWLCKERAGEWRELITPDLLGAILSALDGGAALRASTLEWFEHAREIQNLGRSVDELLARYEASRAR